MNESHEESNQQREAAEQRHVARNGGLQGQRAEPGHSAQGFDGDGGAEGEHKSDTEQSH